MSVRIVPNYQAAPYSDPNREEDIVVYNETGSAISNGAIYALSFYVSLNADSEPVVQTRLNTPKTIATNTAEIVVVNDPRGEIPTVDYGIARKAGVVQALCDGGTDITLGDQLEVITDGTAFIQNASASSGDSGDIVVNTAAIAMEAYTVNTNAAKWVLLLGKQVAVAGS